MKNLQSSFVILDGLVESVYKNVFCDQIQPIRGSILKVDLALNPVASMCHTGIYVGHNRIVEMTNDDGTGIIKKVSPNYFLNYSLWRTGLFIYVACGKKNGKYYPLGSEDIAERAEQAIGNTVDYNLLLENCHLFTEKCIAGEEDSLPGNLEGGEGAPVAAGVVGECLPLPPIGTLGGVEDALIRKFNPPQEISWEEERVDPYIKTLVPQTPREVRIVRSVFWMSTGVSSNDSFPDD